MGQLFAYTRLAVAVLFSDVAGRLFGLSAGNTGSRLSSVPLFPALVRVVGIKKSRGKTARANCQSKQNAKGKKKFKNIQKHCGGKYNKEKSAEGAPPDRCQHIASGTFIAQANC